ncbi:MAG: helicase-related protein, partial [Bifidobacteriaceae bacterium]|nr:helicase-related protein [Bifidobacteriaceae bacterium]
YNDRLQFTHPAVMVIAPQDAMSAMAFDTKADAASVREALQRVARPQPVYHASSRISSEHIHDAILGVLHLLDVQGGAERGDAAQDSVATADQAASAGQSAPSPKSARQSAASKPSTERKPSAEPTLAPPEPATINPANLASIIPDVISEGLRSGHGLLHRAEAFCAIHNPSSTDEFQHGIDTLRYEEALVSQVSLLRERADARKSQAFVCEPAGGDDAVGDDLETAFIKSLPFELTQGQKDVIADIDADMTRPWPMQRLLQGEVGSGKTVVALAAMLRAVGAGKQAVLVAPTQVLAEQHFEGLQRMLAKVPGADDIPVVLLTGGMKLAQRRKSLAAAASGAPCLVVATHAAFSKTFQAPNLALVVIDEQHRFGVEQRQTLLEGDGPTPHMLVMTATPIPRTAAMTWFGNLDISWLTELPGGRKPITSVVINEADNPTMGQMFVHIRHRIDAGERAYIVCARIDEDDANSFDEGYDAAPVVPEADLDGDGVPDDTQPAQPLHSVEQMSQRLEALPQFRGVTFATLTGRDDDATKRDVMERFASGAVQVLVATTVIEVGVDVPQASNIVIFDAEHYGLSQLHQLRGRVGRGGTRSWAFFITRAEPGSLGAQRLEVIRKSTDGAQIARADLELRGAGDVLGDVQSGKRSSLRLLRVVTDADVIEQARTDAEALLEADPQLAGNVELAGAVVDFMRTTQADAA